jgi:hypothetical protein
MRWEDERYVRVYTRDTADWLALSFDAQSLFMHLLRKVDRAGVLDLGRQGKRAVASTIGHMSLWDRLSPALEELLLDGCVRIEGSTLVIPNYLEAQESRASDKARKREERERARARALAHRDPPPSAIDDSSHETVTKRDHESQDVTKSHDPSHDVTAGHAASHAVTPYHAVPCLSVPEEMKKESPRVIELALDPPPPKPKPMSDVDRVFDHWRKAMNSPRSKMDSKRRARIEWALAEYDFETCVQAIDGCALSDFHMGHDPKTNGAKHNGIKVIFRDADQVDRFVGIWNEQRTATASAPATIVFDPSLVAANLEAKRKIAEIAARLRPPLTDPPDSLDPMEASNG